jgi:hypothetical protein
MRRIVRAIFEGFVSAIMAAVILAACLFVVGETVDHFTLHKEHPYCPPDPKECGD